MTIVRTQLEEVMGCGLRAQITGTVQLPTPSGVGGYRLHWIRANGTVTARLPSAARMSAGGPITIVCDPAGSGIIITDAAGTVLELMSPSDVCECWLQQPGTAAGVWAINPRRHGPFSPPFNLFSGPVSNTRREFALEILTTRTDVDIAADLAAAFGAEWGGQSPVAVSVRVAAGVVVGASSTNRPAMTTGDLPAGSLSRITIEDGAVISGRGGRGGRGGDGLTPGLLPQNGQDGGPALYVQVPTVLVNRGRIQGGGGGGGGGSRAGQIGGGGGGGGAGWETSRPGEGGGNGGQPGQGGGVGTAGGGGGGVGGPGGSFGAPGGGPGAPGGNAGAIGGQPGNAIVRFAPATLTTIAAGLILGPQVTF